MRDDALDVDVGVPRRGPQLDEDEFSGTGDGAGVSYFSW